MTSSYGTSGALSRAEVQSGTQNGAIRLRAGLFGPGVRCGGGSGADQTSLKLITNGVRSWLIRSNRFRSQRSTFSMSLLLGENFEFQTPLICSKVIRSAIPCSTFSNSLRIVNRFIKFLNRFLMIDFQYWSDYKREEAPFLKRNALPPVSVWSTELLCPKPSSIQSQIRISWVSKSSFQRTSCGQVYCGGRGAAAIWLSLHIRFEFSFKQKKRAPFGGAFTWNPVVRKALKSEIQKRTLQNYTRELA